MDRDRRWDRTQRAYDLLVHGPCRYGADGRAGGATRTRGRDRRVHRPTLVGEDARIRRHDSVICFNFRPDRMREITRALAEPGFGEVGEELPGWGGRGGGEPVRSYATFTQYEEGWPYPVAFAPDHP